MIPSWKSLRYRLEAAVVRLLAALLPRLPRPVAFQLGRTLGALAAQLDFKGRAVALSNLAAAFGDKFSTAQRKEIVRGSYQQFAGTMVDLFWSPRLNEKNFRRLIEFEGLDEFERSVGRENPFIFACFHYGNFELLNLGFGWIGITGSLLTQEFKNAQLDPIFDYLRQRSGQEIVGRSGGIVRLYRALRRGGRVALLVDFALPLHQPTVAINCFGLQTSATFAHAWLAKKTGAPIIPIHAEPLPGGRCRVVIHPKLEFSPEATHQQIAKLCWDSFEPVVRRNPAPWMWMYKYWRYRPAKATQPYPDYARENPRFDALIAASTSDAALPAD